MSRMMCFTQDSPKSKGRQNGWEIFASERLAIHIDEEIREGPMKEKLLLSE